MWTELVHPIMSRCLSIMAMIQFDLWIKHWSLPSVCLIDFPRPSLLPPFSSLPLKGEVDVRPDKWQTIDLYLINNLLETLSPSPLNSTSHPSLLLSVRSQTACETQNEEKRGDAWAIYSLIDKSWPNIYTAWIWGLEGLSQSTNGKEGECWKRKVWQREKYHHTAKEIKTEIGGNQHWHVKNKVKMTAWQVHVARSESYVSE